MPASVDISAHDLIAEGKKWGLPAKRAQRVVYDMLDAVHTVVQAVDLAEYPGVSELALETVRRRVADGRHTRSSSPQAMPPSSKQGRPPRRAHPGTQATTGDGIEL